MNQLYSLFLSPYMCDDAVKERNGWMDGQGWHFFFVFVEVRPFLVDVKRYC